MKKLIDIYGYCIIPKHTLLFRGHADTSFDDCMFFTTKHWVAGAFSDTIQVWKTTTDIQVLFLVEYVTYNSWTISALPRLYKQLFPTDRNKNLNDLDIKYWNISKPNKLVRKLFDEHKISGWLSSLEDRVEMEVCLFDRYANEKQLTLADTCNRKNEKYFKDSLQRIKIFPSPTFYNQTTKKLNKHGPILRDEKDRYQQHKRIINAGIKQYLERGMTRVEAKHYMLDLRTKLKV